MWSPCRCARAGLLVFIASPASAAAAQQRVSVSVLLYSSNASTLSAPVDAREEVWPVAALLQLCIALLQLCCSFVAASKLSAPVDAREKVWPVAALLQLCIALLQLCCSSVAASKLSAPVYAREEVWPRAKRVNEVLAPQLPHLQKKRHVKKKERLKEILAPQLPQLIKVWKAFE